MKVYHDKDVDMEILKDKTITVIGYGIQGRAQALCMKDSGLNVIAGLRKGKSWDLAEKDGMEVLSVEDAAKKADIICMLIPDMVQPKVYKEQIAPHMSEGKVLYFSHGFNITFKQIQPSPKIDVIMVAPKAPGKRLREVYLEGFGVPALAAVHQDYSGKAKEIALAMAKGMHFTRAGVIELVQGKYSPFDQETFSDLLGEQAVLCGGVSELIKTGFETLIENEFPPELAYFECLNELKLIVDLIYERGIGGMYRGVSNTAKYGGMSRGSFVMNDEVKKRMKKLLDDIISGEFAKEWLDDFHKNNQKKFNELLEKEAEHPIEKIGSEIRKMFEKKKS